jgi:hypothetical protein
VGDDAEVFDRFWVQAVRYLAEGRSLAGHRRGTLETDREHYELGETVTLRARVVGPTYEPLTAESLRGELSAPDGAQQEITLLPMAGQPGRFEATWTAREAGAHRIQIKLDEAKDATHEPVHLETAFRVDFPSAEANRQWMNRPLLEELANLSGGRYFDIADAMKLPEAIPDRSERLASRGAPRPLWDRGGVLVVLVALLGSEWLMRKFLNML